MSYDIRDHVREDIIHTALHTNHDNRVTLEIDWDGSDFRDTWCDIHRGMPAAVHVAYARDEGDEHEDNFVACEATYSWAAATGGSWAAATGAIAAILDDDQVIDNQIISVRVNAHALVYTLNAPVAA